MSLLKAIIKGKINAHAQTDIMPKYIYMNQSVYDELSLEVYNTMTRDMKHDFKRSNRVHELEIIISKNCTDNNFHLSNERVNETELGDRVKNKLKVIRKNDIVEIHINELAYVLYFTPQEAADWANSLLSASGACDQFNSSQKESEVH